MGIRLSKSVGEVGAFQGCEQERVFQGWFLCGLL